MTNLKELFSRTSKGAVQSWIAQVEDNKFRTVSGQIDGKKVTSQWTYCQGKNLGKSNETSPEEQALNEALAKWQKKIDSGYKIDIKDIDTMAFIEPMLAKNYDDRKDKIVFPVYSQPKLDGIRCIAKKEGLFSRNGKEFYPWPHIMNSLATAWETMPDLVFDGELYADDLSDNFNEIISLAKKIDPDKDEIKNCAKILQYHIYDTPSSNMNFGDRHKYLVSILEPTLIKNSPIKLVETYRIESFKELDNLMTAFIEDGYEGQMVRLDTVYEFKRSSGLLKRKEFCTDEFEILSVTEGHGNKTGWAASMSFKMPSGQDFDSNVKGPESLLTEYWIKKNDLIGKRATIRYFALTPDGIPRFPYVIAIRDYE